MRAAIVAIILCVGLTTAQAAEVHAIGTGASYREALANAKLAATEQVAGVLVMSRTTIANGTVNRGLLEHAIGKIREYRIDSSEATGGIYRVNITADVGESLPDYEPVANSSGGIVTDDVRNALRRARQAGEASADYGRLAYSSSLQAMKIMDAPDSALQVTVGETRFTYQGETTRIEIPYEMRWSPRWLATFQKTLEQIGLVYDLEKKSRYVTCFDRGDRCYQTYVGLADLTTKYCTLSVVLDGFRTRTVYVRPEEIQWAPKPMYRMIYPGTILNCGFWSRGCMSNASGIVIYQEGFYRNVIVMDVPTPDVENLRQIRIAAI